jgi:hypothetical protein
MEKTKFLLVYESLEIPIGLIRIRSNLKGIFQKISRNRIAYESAEPNSPEPDKADKNPGPLSYSLLYDLI